ncbi:MAG TPA: hypothetical protein DCM17_07765 [Dehalococcoidia bacterium]|nr:hypothetical protein [Dehalococcoidia bacterium]
MVLIGASDAFNPKAAFPMGRQSLGYEQTYPRTGFLFSSGYFWRPTVVEDMFGVLAGYTRSVIPNPHDEMRIVPA